MSANITFVNLDLKIVCANQAAAISANKAPEEMVGVPCYKFRANSYEICENCPSERVIQSKKKEHQIIKSPDGRVWDETGEPVFDESGNLVGIVEIAQDITDKIKAEEALKASEEKFRRALEFLPVPIAVADNKGEIVFHNRQFINTYGYTIEDIPDQSVWFDVVYPDPEYRNFVINDWTNAVEQAKYNNSTTSVREYYITGKNGDIKLVAVSAFIGMDYSFGLFVDITEQRRMEQALRESEERLRAIGDNIPKGQIYQLLVEKDGTSRFTYVSKNIEELHECTPEEALANPLLLFGRVVPDDADGLRMATEKSAKDLSVFDHTVRIMRKSGEIRWHRMISRPRKNDDGTVIFDGIDMDISEKKVAENIIKIRLNLIEYSEHHSLSEFLRMSIDEVCRITGSRIGFFHFVDPDEKSLTLQTWSTRTLKEFCTAESAGKHYRVDQAGVWVDCIAARAPVIHNDYASLPHRKGLPEGHAEVVRELVVPISREKRIVAILGVGNKSSNYNEQDAELVSYLADVVWSIAEKIKADEQIRQLNARLERLVMIDYLTDLPNRRAFFLQGAKEISRAERNKTSFSLLMLDLDHFKSINDTYGHDAGDFVLKQFSNLLRENIRESDMAARLGGEEFSILLPETELKYAAKFAERIRQAVEQERMRVQDQIINMTVSIGVVSYSENLPDLKSVIKQADDYLYQAKTQGRNQVVSQD